MSNLELFTLCRNTTSLLRKGSESRELYLPQVQAEDADVVIVTNGRVRLVFRVVYFWMNPFPLVIGVVNDPGFPFPLKQRTRMNMTLTISPLF